MIFHPLFLALTSLLTTMYNLLPPWTFSFDTFPASTPATGHTTDGGAVAWLFLIFSTLDRFMPMHDALLPILAISASVTLGLLVFKAIKFVLSLIPTVSAGG